MALEVGCELQEWTQLGITGQTDNIRCNPASESDTDPELSVLSPDGAEFGSDYESEGNRSKKYQTSHSTFMANIESRSISGSLAFTYSACIDLV